LFEGDINAVEAFFGEVEARKIYRAYIKVPAGKRDDVVWTVGPGDIVAYVGTSEGKTIRCTVREGPSVHPKPKMCPQQTLPHMRCRRNSVRAVSHTPWMRSMLRGGPPAAADTQ
jgi:hypothetical protein